MITPPPRIGRFTVQRVIGHGGMGVVYLAKDPQLGRDVAIKVLPPLADNDAADRLLNEARISGRFVHPNVIAIYEVGDEQGYPFFVMPYVEGRTIEAIVKTDAQVPLSLKLRWMVELCRGLAYAHSFQVIHRDIKPGNLIVDSYDVLRILDFGIAKVVATTQVSFTAIGTPAYMAPEQCSGAPVDARTDVFAAGLVLFELLTGVRARRGDNAAQVYRQVASGALPPIRDLAPGIDAGLEAICKRATAADPAARYQTAREFGDALERAQTRAAYTEQEAGAPGAGGDEAPTVTPPPVPPPPPAPPALSHGDPPPVPPPMPGPVDPAPRPPGPAPNRRPPTRLVPALLIAASAIGLAAVLIVPFVLGLWQRHQSASDPGPAPVPPAAPRSSPVAAPESRRSGDTTASPPPAAPVRVGGSIRAPTRLRHVAPVYPSVAQSARIQGVVTIEATIAASGKVEEAHVLRSIPLLDQAAVDAVRQWEFAPTHLNGVAVPVIMAVTVDFTLSDGPAADATPAPAAGMPEAAAPASRAAPFTARADERGTFASDAGLLLVHVAAGSEAPYERLLRRVRDALHHPSTGRAAMAAGWRVYRAQDEAAGNALYVHLVDPPVRGADYVQLYRLVQEASADDAAALAAATKSAFPEPVNRLDLRLVRAPIQRGGARLDGAHATDDQATFTTSSGLLLVTVKPGETDAYEGVVDKVFQALSRHQRAERRAMAEHWLVYRSDAAISGQTLYVSRIEPTVPGANYLNVYQIVTEAFGSQEGYAVDAAHRRSIGTSINRLDLRLILDMSSRN